MIISLQAQKTENKEKSTTIRPNQQPAALRSRKETNPNRSFWHAFMDSANEKLKPLKWWNKPQPKSRRLFFLQLEKMFDAGISLHRALEFATDADEDPIFHKATIDVSERVLAGTPLSKAFQAHPTIFTKAQCAAIAVGERTGTLPLVLRRLGEEEEKKSRLTKHLISEITYPLIAFCLAVPLAFISSGVILKPIQKVLEGLVLRQLFD